MAEKPCDVCKTLAPTRCSGCSVVHYCGSKCQRSAWKQHKKACGDLRRTRWLEEKRKEWAKVPPKRDDDPFDLRPFDLSRHSSPPQQRQRVNVRVGNQLLVFQRSCGFGSRFCTVVRPHGDPSCPCEACTVHDVQSEAKLSLGLSLQRVRVWHPEDEDDWDRDGDAQALADRIGMRHGMITTCRMPTFWNKVYCVVFKRYSSMFAQGDANRMRAVQILCFNARRKLVGERWPDRQIDESVPVGCRVGEAEPIVGGRAAKDSQLNGTLHCSCPEGNYRRGNEW